MELTVTKKTTEIQERTTTQTFLVTVTDEDMGEDAIRHGFESGDFEIVEQDGQYVLRDRNGEIGGTATHNPASDEKDADEREEVTYELED